MLGRHSLFVYWVHVEIAYGIFMRPWQKSFALTEDANRPVGAPHPVQQIPEKEHVDIRDIVEGDDGSLHFLIILAAS